MAKSILLIEHLAEVGTQPLGEIAAAVGQSRPTVHRLLGSLVGLGYVARVEEGVYGLTSKLRRIALGGDESRLIAAAERPLMRLRSKTGETANFGVLRGANVRYIHSLPSPHPLRRVVIAGEVDPFYCTALGRVLAAHLPASRRQALMKSAKFVKRSSRTEIDPTAIRRLIDAAGIDGYAIEHDQTDLGVSCIAAPVRDGDEVVAAVSISGVTARIQERPIRQLVREVCDAAGQVTKALRGTSA